MSRTSLDIVHCCMLGGVTHEDEQMCYIHSAITPFQFAAEKFQRAFFSVLREVNFKECEFISLPYLGTFQVHTKALCYKPKLKNVDFISYFPFITFPLVGNISRSLIAFRELKKKYSKIGPRETLLIFVYAMHEPFISAATKLKKQSPGNVKVILVVPDLPNYMSKHRGLIGSAASIVKSFEASKLSKSKALIDGYVGFTQGILEAVNSRNHPEMVVYGLDVEAQWSPEQDLEFSLEKLKEVSGVNVEVGTRYFVYAGGLSKRYGAEVMIDAFIELSRKQQDIKLVVCGAGESESYVKAAAARFSNIVFVGTLENKVVRLLQKNALGLINPRPPEGEYLKYSFPSKMIEYCATGKPIVGFSLASYPQELKGLLFEPKQLSPSEVAKTITLVSNLTPNELEQVSNKSKLFIDKYCSKEKVREKIINLVKEITE